MILGMGIDHIEVKRIEKSIKSDAFVRKIFSANEVEYCSSNKQFVQCYAARFAAKEAFLKALGTGLRGKMRFQDIEIVNDDLGKPMISLLGETKKICDDMQVNNIHVSLSHLKDSAMAVVVLEK